MEKGHTIKNKNYCNNKYQPNNIWCPDIRKETYSFWIWLSVIFKLTPGVKV